MSSNIILNQKSIIAICGYKRSGKDTLANHLLEHYGFKRKSFADPVKEIAGIIFGFTAEQLNGDDKDKFVSVLGGEWDITPREAFRFIGTDIGQYKMNDLLPNIGRKLWCYSVFNEYDLKPYRLVIPDLRFRHEFDEIKKRDGYVIRVIKDGITSDGNISEREGESFQADMTIYNNAGIYELHANLERKISN